MGSTTVTTPELLELVRDIPPERRPRHIAIIMDGNGRWAVRQGLPRLMGHQRGAVTARQVSEMCSDLGIEQLTLYCLSSENWKRPAEELDFLMHLLQQFMIEERQAIMNNNLRVRMLGRRSGIPEPVLRELDLTVEMSQQNTGMRLNMAINYGSRGELLDAVRDIASKVEAGQLRSDAITEQVIADHLYTAGLPDPDLLIRTAGEMRVSNFLLWQISYAELWVTSACWPEFDHHTLAAALRDFASRDRKFGGLPDLA